MPDLLFRFPAVSLGLFLLVAMVLAAAAGRALRRRWLGASDKDADNEAQEGYIVSSVVTLLIFMIGFTFAIVLDRFESRRQLVGEDARAIQQLYLQAQILDEPHRSRLSGLLVHYTDNRILLAQQARGELKDTMAENDRLLHALWTATIAAFGSIRGIDFSSAFVDSSNKVIEMNAARIAARGARIPTAVFVLVFAYTVVTASVFGYVLQGHKGRVSSSVLMILCVAVIMLLTDLNQPVSGWIRESQQPMQILSQWMHANPPESFGKPPATLPR
jgi:hypothetical protein